MSYLYKTAAFGILTALLSTFGLIKMTALAGLAASGLFGVILAALIAGAGFTAYYTIVDAVVKSGFLGNKAMSAEQAIPVSAVATVILLVLAPMLHLFAAAGIFQGLISLVAYVAADHLTDEQAQPAARK